MIEKQPFGRTGHLSTRAIFGGAALGKANQAEAGRTLDLLLEYGINHIDTAASYGDSELRIGPWMARHRNDFFLATKTEKRTYREAKEELHRSLERLAVDSVDLWQMHLLVDPHQWQVAMGPGGALEAFVEAREQGLVRFLGVTGHGTSVAAMHRQSLARFDFDSVLLPYSFVLLQNQQYAADVDALLALCRQKNVAVQTIKSIVRRPWGSKTPTRNTWYEPLERQADIDRAVHWVLNRPGLFLNTAADIDLLPKVLSAADRFKTAPAEGELESTVDRLAMKPLFD
ncbi:MAG: aldo/keto reductase [Anaerolineae bacterium]